MVGFLYWYVCECLMIMVYFFWLTVAILAIVGCICCPCLVFSTSSFNGDDVSEEERQLNIKFVRKSIKEFRMNQEGRGCLGVFYLK